MINHDFKKEPASPIVYRSIQKEYDNYLYNSLIIFQKQRLEKEKLGKENEDK
jgi:hypothetical protein